MVRMKGPRKLLYISQAFSYVKLFRTLGVIACSWDLTEQRNSNSPMFLSSNPPEEVFEHNYVLYVYQQQQLIFGHLI